MYQYDHTNPLSIEEYGKRMIGHTFGEILSWADNDVVSDVAEYGNAARKGGLGNLIEERFFGYKANSEAEADFKEAGVELKATPYEKKKNGELKAGERLVLSMIANDRAVEDDFYTSHLWTKCKLILLVYYLRDKSLGSNMNYPIDFVKLFTPTAVDLAIIEQDYKAIIEKIKDGRAHELSESDTLYLGACTKGATAEKSTVPQFYPPHIPARRRAFCYKISYMTHVLNEYIIKDVATYEPAEQIIKDVSVLKEQTFEQYIEGLINRYAGKTDRELCDLFNVPYTSDNRKAKAMWSQLSFRMLGISSNKADEFVKANIEVKTFRIHENGSLAEAMSFPTFSFNELVNEEWEESVLHNYFAETKFLFVIFKEKGSNLILKGCQLWNMGYSDLEETVKGVWEDTVYKALHGVEFEIKTYGKDKVKVLNNFISEQDEQITFVKPHAGVSYYQFLDGTVVCNQPEKATEAMKDVLPDGTIIPKCCFWLGKKYILSQLREDLK